MVYPRRQTRQKPRKAEVTMLPAPIGGWISNRSLAMPSSGTPGAILLDNYVPRASTVKLRRGTARYATLENESIGVTALFSYRNGLNEKLFAANENVIYDISSVPSPYASQIVTEKDELIVTENGDWFGWGSTAGMDVMTGLTGGDWIVAQFATTGGVYLVGVNGVDNGFIYDGTEFLPNLPGGIWVLPYDGEVTPFEEGETVTGGTSSATGVVFRVNDSGGGVGTLYLRDVVGDFEDNDALTGSVAGDAVATGAQTPIFAGITFGSTALTTADMSFVWVYKNRLWFVEKNSMNAWYMPVDQIAGAAVLFPLAGIFTMGGSLLWGQAWSLSSGGDGGLSEQCVFTSTEGQVAIYQGISPDEADTWSKAGTYRIGRPLGKRSFFHGGGDLAVGTTAGLVPLSKAIELDVTTLNVATLSYNISDAWSDAISMRGTDSWVAELWPEQKLAIISPPDLIGSTFPVLFVANAETGAWCRFTGWQALCMEVFKGQLYFGTTNGRVQLANVGGTDEGEVYTGRIIPLFIDGGTPSSLKVGGMVRAVSRANAKVNPRLCMNYDFDESLPSAPTAITEIEASLWGQGIWGQSKWGELLPTIINQDWYSGGGMGYTFAPTYQVSSGSIGGVDDEVIRFEVSFCSAEAVT